MLHKILIWLDQHLLGFNKVKNGFKEGLHIYAHDNGKMHSRGYYVKGQREGFWEMFYEDETIMMETQYRSNKTNGLSVSYHKNGKVMMRYTNKMGKIDGITEHFNEEGALTSRSLYKDNKKVKELDIDTAIQ